MKKLLLVILLGGSIIFSGQSVQAQDQEKSTPRVGIGAMINSPTGLSVKAWINEDIAIDGALSFDIVSNASQFYFHADVLKHKNIETDQLQPYFGMGLRLIWTDIGNDILTGLRVPGGLVYSFEDSNINSFFEVAPTIDFNPDFRFSFAGAVGVRFYLD